MHSPPSKIPRQSSMGGNSHYPLALPRMITTRWMGGDRRFPLRHWRHFGPSIRRPELWLKNPIRERENGTHGTRPLADVSGTIGASGGSSFCPDVPTWGVKRIARRRATEKGVAKTIKGPKSDKGPSEQSSSADISADPGSSVAYAAFQSGSGAYAGRSGVVLDTGAAANLACFAWQRHHNGLMKGAAYDVTAAYPT